MSGTRATGHLDRRVDLVPNASCGIPPGRRVVIVAFLLPPVIDQTIQRVPLGPWSTLAFGGLVVAAAYLAYRRSPLSLAVLAFAVPFAAYRDIGNTTITIEKCLVFGTAVGLILSGVPMLPARGGATRFWTGCLLLAAVAISLWHAVYPIHIAREFLKQAEYLVVFWCAATLVEQAAEQHPGARGRGRRRRLPRLDVGGLASDYRWRAVRNLDQRASAAARRRAA